MAFPEIGLVPWDQETNSPAKGAPYSNDEPATMDWRVFDFNGVSGGR